MDARDAGAATPRRRRPGGDAPGADDATELTVTDLRQPGWSWGWDTLAREFAALLQLKGVGLYFTYATYTDNRPNSPYRGSSYTGIEALAEFSGEAADDIRTINKILTALGLARFKTYTVRTRGKDGRPGTRNRVHCYILERDPHLRSEDVLAVLRLAASDPRVYKYVRHVFRPTFRPIDRAEDAAGTPREHPNPWYRVLPEIRRTPEWRALALRAERDLLTLRARNLHGVEAAAARRRAERVEEVVDAEEDAGGTILRVSEDGTPTCVRNTEGGGVLPVTEAAGAGVLRNRDPGPPTIVRGSEGNHDQGGHEPRPSVHDKQTRDGTTTTTTRALALHPSSATPRRRVAGAVAAHEPESLFELFAQANGRAASEVEQLLLLRMADEFERPARKQSSEHTGRLWVMAAIVEAVDAGSPFVSPRRIRRICERWAKEGFRSARAAAGAGPKTPWLGFPEVEMPNGQTSRVVWRRVIGIARGSLNADALIERLDPCYISGYDRWQRELEVTAPDQHTAEKLRQSYGAIIERALAMIFGQPTRFRAVAAGGAGGNGVDASGPDETRRSWQTYRPDDDDAAVDDEETDAGAAEPAGDEDFPADAPIADGAAEDDADPAATGCAPKPAPGAPAPPPALLELLEPGELVDGCTTHQAWAVVLDALGRGVSSFRLRLFEAQTALVGWEDDEELLVVGTNGFVLDQLRAHADVVLAALRPLVGDGRPGALRYTTWPALLAADEAGHPDGAAPDAGAERDRAGVR